MNFNVYLDDESARRLDALARRERVARNALIRRAVVFLLDASRRGWPKEVLAFRGEPAVQPFEAHRAELAPTADDPFAGLPRANATRTRRKAAPRGTSR